MEGNPKFPGALDVLLLCPQSAAFPSSLDVLERCSCARRNQAVFLFNLFSCLSPMRDCFRAELFPGSEFLVCCVVRLHHTACINGEPVALSCLSSPTALADPGEGDLWGTHQSLWLVCVQVKREGACETCSRSLQLCCSCSHHGPFPYSSSPPSLTFLPCLLHPVPR